MAQAKESGAYYQIIDQSFQALTLVQLEVVVPMLTQAGELGALTRVTNEDFEEKVGYDLTYNPLYYGLKLLTEALDYVDVLRINHDPAFSNAILLEDGSVFNASNILDFDALAAAVSGGTNCVGIAAKTPGSSMDLRVNINYVFESQSFTSAASIALGLETKVSTVRVYSVAGVLLAEENSGTLVEVGSSGLSGTVTRTGGDTTLALTGYTGWTAFVVEYAEADSTEYVVRTYRVDSSSSAVLLAEETVSSAATDSNYINIYDFEYLNLELYTTLVTPILGVDADLDNGTNGSVPTVDQLDLTPLESSPAVLLAMNGITSISLVNAFAEKAASLRKSILIDTPAYTKWEDLLAWQASLYATEFAQLYAVPDQVVTSVGTIHLFPSVNVVKAYAEMFNQSGSLLYVPAGYQFGAVNASNLLKTNLNLYGDQAKFYKVNYQRVGSQGPVIWEQRTRYGAESDLSYSNTVWTLRQLGNELASFMENFTFRIQTPMQLTLIQSGLSSILNDYQEQGFLWQSELLVPTWQDVLDDASRTVEIKVKVQVAKDGEVFNIGIIPTNEF